MKGWLINMNDLNSPIQHMTSIYHNEGYITYQWKKVYFKIAKLTYELFPDESFQYIFEPYYDVLDAIDGLEIPGIDLTLRQQAYYRVNVTPVFVSERITPKNRVNLIEELKEYNLDYHQPFLLLLDAHKQYGGDHLSLKSDTFYLNLENNHMDENDLYKLIPKTLQTLASRSNFILGSIIVNSVNRTILIKNYCHLYEKVSHYYQNKIKRNRGRAKQSVPFIMLEETQKLYTNGVITLEEAVKQSGLSSKRTYYRRVKEMKEKEK